MPIIHQRLSTAGKLRRRIERRFRQVLDIRRSITAKETTRRNSLLLDVEDTESYATYQPGPAAVQVPATSQSAVASTSGTRAGISASSRVPNAVSPRNVAVAETANVNATTGSASRRQAAESRTLEKRFEIAVPESRLRSAKVQPGWELEAQIALGIGEVQIWESPNAGSGDGRSESEWRRLTVHASTWRSLSTRWIRDWRS